MNCSITAASCELGRPKPSIPNPISAGAGTAFSIRPHASSRLVRVAALRGVEYLKIELRLFTDSPRANARARLPH